MNLFRVLVLVVALGAGGIAAFLALNMGGGAPEPTVVELAPQIQTQDVLVASADIKQGQALTAENIRWQRWPEESLNASFIQKQTTPDALEKYAGSVVRSQFAAGEPIRDAKLARPECGFLSAILPAGKRAIAVRVSAQNTAGGFVLPNDRVDVVQTVTQTTPGGGSRNVSRTILGNVKVLAIDQTVEEQDGEAVVVGKTATLELSSAQVELVTAAEASGTLSLALRSFEDTEEIAGAPEVVASEAPEPPVATSSTIRIFRAGRAQSITIRPDGVIEGAVSVEVPRYDPNAHCRTVAEADGEFSEEVFRGCLDQEQSSYDALKTQWASIPPATRDHCDGVARACSPGSYVALSSCVEQQQTASEDNQDQQAAF